MTTYLTREDLYPSDFFVIKCLAGVVPMLELHEKVLFNIDYSLTASATCVTLALLKARQESK